MPIEISLSYNNESNDDRDTPWLMSLHAELASVMRFVVSGPISKAERQALAEDVFRVLAEDNRIGIIIDYRAATLNASPEDAMEFAKGLDRLAVNPPAFGIYVIPAEHDRPSIDISAAVAGALRNVPVNVCAELNEAYIKIEQRKRAVA